jgi:hypothetical protein
MGIAHGHLDIPMAQQFGGGPQVNIQANEEPVLFQVIRATKPYFVTVRCKAIQTAS